MNTQTRPENRSVTPTRSSSPETFVGFAVMGCLVAGAVGILKALEMESGSGILFCLLGSVAAFGTVYFIYFGKK